MLFLRAPPHGKYPVGATTFILPVNYQEIGHAKLHSANSLKPALSLEEVAFTVYYPAHVGNKTRYGLDWLPR
jgi:platelet-activating factor acetylhydrolase